MRRTALWTVLVVTTVTYIAVVVWGLSKGLASDAAAVLWVLLIVPTMVASGAFLAIKRPHNPIGELLTWAAIAIFLIPTIVEVPTVILFGRSGAQNWMWAPMWLSATLTGVGFVLLMMLIVLLPDGRVRYPRERRFLRASWIVVVFPTLSLVSNQYVITPPQAFPGVGDIASPWVLLALAPYGAVFAGLTSLGYALFIGAVTLQVMRYRRAQVRERKQIRWVLYAGVIAIALGALPYLLEVIGLIGPLGHTLTAALLSVVPMLIFPASVVVAVMEPPWVDVDIVIRKSFVYGALSLVILLLYIGVAAAFGVAAGARLDVEIAVVLTVVIALLFQPARRRLQLVADQWVFGVRPTKYEAVAVFGETIEQASDPTELLPQLVETIQKTVGLKWASARLDDGSYADIGNVSGEPALTATIGAGDEKIGVIDCGPKEQGAIDADEIQLVYTLAGQVGLALMNARLAGRIVNAAETERRRIERNIHDGAQQELVALVARLGMAKSAASQGQLTPETIDDLSNETQRILHDLRELAQGIHPSVLTDGGILEAVEDRCAHMPLNVSLDAPEGLRYQRFDDDIEGAAYFFVTESLTNVMKHADASYANVSLSQYNGQLVLEVSDDGRGFDAESSHHHGLSGLRDRIRALGGTVTISSRAGHGTRVSASLPMGQP